MVYHQSTQKLQKDVIIGELQVSLKSLSELRLKKEVKIVEELKYCIDSKVQNSFNFSSIFTIHFNTAQLPQPIVKKRMKFKKDKWKFYFLLTN